MNLYGILGHCLPAFGRIVGQMQHDLFHVYTVDEHILMVIRNLRRFTEPQHAHEYPLCSRLIADFERKEVLYLAGLFHDIAKGRGGDHSTLGAARCAALLSRARAAARGRRARRLARRASISRCRRRRRSRTSRTRTSSPPSPRKVGNERRLIALYLLTVADIRGTSPRVWNAWKAQLLEDLFHATRRVLAGEGAGAHAAGLAAAAAGRGAASAAPLRGARRRRARAVAAARHAVLPAPHRGRDRVARAPSVLARRQDATPVVQGAPLTRRARVCRLLVYLPDQKHLFARICGFFGRRGLSILEAKIHTTRHGYALDTFAVHDPTDRERVLPRHDPADRVRAHRAAAGAAAARAAGGRAREPAASSTSRSRRRCRSSPTTRARTTSSRSSPATGRACSRRSRRRSRRPTSTSRAPRSTRSASAPRTSS